MLSNIKFEELYNKLNPAQKRAVDAVEGPVMVVAGPGTGKTQILTLRIANILRATDTNPGNILALTFTEAAAANMRRRLADIIGSAGYEVSINTFHSFCNDIIKKYPEEFPAIIGAEHIREIEQVKLIESLIEDAPLEYLKPFGEPFYYLRSILASLNELKREGIAPDIFKKITDNELKNFELIEDLYYASGPHKGKMKGDYQKLQKQILKNKELAVLYVSYQDALRVRKLYDYSDMIMEVLRALQKNKNLLLLLQEAHQYILVDEHQDTNNSQNKIIELLCNFHANPNIFVVGDEKQAIFRFQGASLENFLYFKKLYPSAELVVLEENYRSTQSLLDSAYSLLASSKPLRSNSSHKNQKIKLRGFNKPESEFFAVAREIEEKIKSGHQPGEIAILYRDNRDAFPVAAMLGKLGIPFSIESDEDILNDYDIKKFIAILRAVADFGREEHLAPVLHIDFLKIDPLLAYKIIEGAHRDRKNIYDILRSAQPEFYGRLSSWAAFSKNRSLGETFETVVRESGFLGKILGGSDAPGDLAKVGALFEEASAIQEKNRDAGLTDFLEYLDAIAAHKLLIKKHSASRAGGGVRLMTAHKSKGQEFDFVYIINVFDGHWGGRRRAEQIKLPARIYSLSEASAASAESKGYQKVSDDDSDERRLFYVALTRARREAHISYSKTDINGAELLPSKFISEIKPELTDTSGAEALENEFTGRREILFAPRLAATVELKNQEFIKELFDHNGLSVTALNNYLKCPWKYFYTNLLRIPRAKVKHQMYGTAIHASLKDYFDELRHCEESSTRQSYNAVDKNFLLDQFSYHLHNEPLRETDLEEALARGREALSGYYEAHNAGWITNVINEMNVTGVLLTPEIRLTGKIDKVEILDNLRVNVVDYKTGHPKTRGEIEGATKNSNGDIKRQLVFYNLLLNKFENGRYKMVSGDIDFVEPDDKRKYRKERFIIAPEEVVALEEQIKRVSAEILSAAFWDRQCEEKDCEFCDLREMMR